MEGTFWNIIAAITAVLSFIGAAAALLQTIKVAQKVTFKTEKLYGKEADQRYDNILKTQPERAPNAFGPDEYKGGSRATPQFEVERFHYDPLTMPPEWKNYTRTARYYYEDKDGKTMVRGWRL
jgi:hypothetical protein